MPPRTLSTAVSHVLLGSCQVRVSLCRAPCRVHYSCFPVCAVRETLHLTARPVHCPPGMVALTHLFLHTS
eukprot:11389627-Alexandrium_andersonii.AAC.1